MKRIVAAVQIAAYLALSVAWTALPAPAASVCATPGNDGAGGTLSSAVNAYYPGSGTASAGSTTITVGAVDTAGGGAATPIAAGDLLLVMQMQDGSIATSNGSTYGDGATGSGYTALGSAGLFEYVAVTAVSGGTITIKGAGTGNGLINTYRAAAANASHGQETFQVVRVPQYISAQLSNNFTAAYWDGSTGGIAALDIASTLNLGGASIYATGDGFRGGGLSKASTSPAGVLNSDWVQSATMNGTPTTNAPAFGFKGEGIAGTPAFTFEYTSFTTPSSPASPTIVKTTTDGYPGGDIARGAPANAGGGGTDMNPATNDSNSGGGGGANGGAGGIGGYPWSTSYPKYSQTSPGLHTAGNYAATDATHSPDLGGRGGAALPASVSRVFLGGGGGGGSNNNGSNNNAFNAYGSSGGTGGGIVMMRIANASGSPATIYANGTTGLAPANDGGGGGGAGGTVVITSPSSFSGLTVHADGAAGTTANASAAGLGNQHGPGGGGGGGIVLTSSPVTSTVAGGAAGTTTTSVTTYGATAGSGGTSSTISASSIPGVGSGAECPSAGGANTLYTGPYDGNEATYRGANETGSFDGSVSATNNNDFTPALIPTGSTQLVNSSTTPGSPSGNAITLASTPTIAIPHSLYWVNGDGASHPVTISAQAPTAPPGWTVQICPDTNNPLGTQAPPVAAPSTPNCAASGTGACPKNAFGWNAVGASNPAANQYTATLCMSKFFGTTLGIVYWVVYTPPSSLTAFSRYDASTSVYDDNVPAAYNTTHDELYAGDVVLTKSVAVVSNGCPSGATPTYSALGVCPGGVLRYTIDYRNIVAGANLGTQGTSTASSVYQYATTKAGSLVLTDDGTLSGVSQTATPNWSTFTGGLMSALQAGVSNASCGGGANPCGDSTAATTFSYDAAHAGGVAATKFTATIGGTSFVLYPINFPGQTGQGTITFAVTVK